MFRRGEENESPHPHPGLDLQTIVRSEDSQILITILMGRRVQGESHPIKPQSAVLSWDAGTDVHTAERLASCALALDSLLRAVQSLLSLKRPALGQSTMSKR